MKSLKSFAFASLSFVAVSDVQADEPVKAQPQPQNQVVSPQNHWAESGRDHRWNLVKHQLQIVQPPATQPQNPASAAQPPSKSSDATKLTTTAYQPVIEQSHKGFLSRLKGRRSHSSSSIPISQATAPAASSSQSQPLPNAK